VILKVHADRGPGEFFQQGSYDGNLKRNFFYNNSQVSLTAIFDPVGEY
jgi:hypothetical protein